MSEENIIVVTGGSGRFAQSLKKTKSKYKFIYPSKNLLNITNLNSIKKILKKVKPKSVLHLAGLSRPMIEHEKNIRKSINLNIIGTANLVNICSELKIKLIYFSTNYVYPGKKGNYKEYDAVLPWNNYAWSKLGGECAVQMYDNHLILRLAMNRKPFPHPKALIDMRKSLMYIEDAAEVTLQLLNETGIINVGGKSQSVYDFVKETNPDIQPITLSEISDVNMATDCTMDTTKMKKVIDDPTV